MRVRTCVLALLLSLVAAVAAQDAAKVESFSPQGQVRDVRQVVVRFSQPMVSFGDPRSESPFDIGCEAKGRGRWADARNWLYDFDQDLPAGVECTFKTKPALKTYAGAEVAAQTFRFSTGGPSIRGAWPDEGEERIDEAQVFMPQRRRRASLLPPTAPSSRPTRTSRQRANRCWCAPTPRKPHAYASS